MNEAQRQLSDSFFWPKSIAFVGASSDEHSIRGRLFRSCLALKFDGTVYPITRSHSDICGIKAYATVSAVGAPIDLAVITIPAKFVIDAVKDCAAAGVRNVMIIASGFAEEGGEAANLQLQLFDIAKRTGMRIAGPNCEGYFNALGHISTTFSPVVEALKSSAKQPAGKRIGVVSQSGGLGFALLNRGQEVALDFSYVISSGNEVDLTAADYLEYMVGDPRTDVILLLCEAIRDGERFRRAAARAATLRKPIVVLKLGASEAGARAARSHTASLTGSSTTYSAIFRRYGIIEAGSLDEAVTVCALLTKCPLPRGRRVGIITASGGGGALAADSLYRESLSAPELSECIQSQIRALIPPHASSLNPVDVTAQGHRTGPVMLECMSILEQSDEVDIILIIISTAVEGRVSIDVPTVSQAVTRGLKPIVFWTYTLPTTTAVDAINSAGTILFDNVKLGAWALSKLADYAAFEFCDSSSTNQSHHVIERVGNSRALTEHAAKQALSKYGLRFNNEHLVDTRQDAVEAAKRLGLDVALKIQSPDILHKTEVGGVIIGLKTEQSVGDAFDAIIAASKNVLPSPQIDGVLVQRMAPRGIEFVIGMVNDETFGPIMMVGFGGINVELFGDVVHAPAPLDGDTAKGLVLSLKSSSLLKGFRGSPPIDIGHLADLMVRLSEVAIANIETVQEMEFNPVILHSDGSGVTIADALIIMK